MRLNTLIAVLVLSMLAAACSAGTGSEPDRSIATTTTAPEPPTSTSSGSGEIRLAAFEVDGAEISTLTALDELPDRASVVRFDGTVIDAGDGPNLCLGGVMESLPPQCGGPVVSDLVMGDWAEEANGVRWGERSVVVSWPPVDGQLELFEEMPFEPAEFPPFEPEELPSQCEDIDEFVPVERLNEWAQANPGRAALVSVVRGGSIGVLRVTDDPSDVIELLRSGDATPCVIEVEYSSAELGALQQDIGDLEWDDAYVTGSGSGSLSNRVEVYLAVADLEAIKKIIGLADDPAMLSFSGSMSILDGT